MKQKIIVSLMAMGCLLFSFMSPEARANIIIKVRALNPLESEESASISYPLPEEISPSDIITKNITFSLPNEEGEEKKNTFNIEYVQDEGCYFIIDEIMLGPREIVTLEVHVRDIWMISPERLSNIRQTAEDLIAQAEAANEPPPDDGGQEDSPVEVVANETVTALKDEIFKQFDGIVVRQEKSSVLKVGVEKHMEAYYENMEALVQLEGDVEMLRYMLEPEEEDGDTQEEFPEEAALMDDEIPLSDSVDLTLEDGGLEPEGNIAE